jgi:glycosyltransferase involved in cell wall biosynthesis
LIEPVGQVSHAEVLQRMKLATALLVPSLWFEGFPVVVAEAFAVGLPVVASDIGSLSNVIVEGQNGLLVRPGDADGLMRRLSALRADPELLSRLRSGARREYQDKYTDESNLEALLDIYRAAVEARAGRSGRD